MDFYYAQRLCLKKKLAGSIYIYVGWGLGRGTDTKNYKKRLVNEKSALLYWIKDKFVGARVPTGTAQPCTRVPPFLPHYSTLHILALKKNKLDPISENGTGYNVLAKYTNKCNWFIFKKWKTRSDVFQVNFKDSIGIPLFKHNLLFSAYSASQPHF